MTRTAWAWGLSAFLGLCGVSAAGDTYQRGVAAYFARDYAQAEASLEDCVAASADPRAWYFKGLAERAQEKHGEAQESIHQGGALLAAGHGDATTIRRSLERVQGPARVYLEAVQSFYAKTRETPTNVIAAGPSPAEEFSQFVSTLGTDAQVAAPAAVAVPAVIESAPGYPMPVEVRYTNCTMGGTCGSVVSTTGTVESAPVVSSGCGSTVYSGASYGYDGGCGAWGGGWGRCRTRIHCGRWHARSVSTCWSGSSCGYGGGSYGYSGCGYDSGYQGCGIYSGGCGGYYGGCGYDSGCGGCGFGRGIVRSLFFWW